MHKRIRMRPSVLIKGALRWCAPLTLDASRESETDTLEDKVNALNAADKCVDAPPPAPTDDDDNNDGGEDLGSLPPPPAEPAPDGEETAQEFFICSAPECGQESYGETDPRDGHFYCNDCWNEYQASPPPPPPPMACVRPASRGSWGCGGRGAHCHAVLSRTLSPPPPAP